MVNIVFFLAIFTIDKDIEHNLRDNTAYSPETLNLTSNVHDAQTNPDAHANADVTETQHLSYQQYVSQFYHENALNEEDFVVLNSHAHGEELTPEGAKAMELKLLKIL